MFFALGCLVSVDRHLSSVGISMSSTGEATANVTRRLSSVSLRRMSTGFTHFIRRRSSFFTNKSSSKRPFQRNEHILPVQEVREKLVATFNRDSDLLGRTDSLDLDKIKSNSWFIERFILEHSEDIFGDENDIIEQSTNSIIECLLWRAQQNVNRLTSYDFPLEFYSSGIITHGISSGNDSIVFIRGKFFQKCLCKWSTLLKQFITHYYELIDSKLPGANSAVIVIDLAHCRLRTFDIQYIYFIIDLVDKYYPNSYRKVYLANASWYIKPGLALTLSFSSFKYQSVISFVTSAQLKHIFDEQSLPPFLGGKAHVHLVVPSRVANIDQIACKHQIDQECIEMLAKVFK